MPLIFAGNEGDSVVLEGAMGFSTLAGKFDSAWCDGAFHWANLQDSGVIRLAFDTSIVTAWIHFEVSIDVTTTSHGLPLATLLDDTGQGVARIVGVTDGLALERWGGASWIVVGSADVTSGLLHKIDLVSTINASVGLAEAFVNGVSIAKFEGDTSLSPGTAFTEATITKSGIHASNDQYVSQIIIASEDTIDWNVETLRVDADGTTGDWAGGASPFLNINEVGLVNTAELIESGTALDISTFSVENPTVLGANREIKGIVHSVSLRNQAVGPQNVEFVTRSGGVDHFHGNLPGVSTGYDQHFLTLEDDPFTGNPWDESDVGVMQPGLRSNT